MNDRLKNLEALIGVWSTTITMINEDGTTGDTSKATDTYQWSPSKSFVLRRRCTDERRDDPLAGNYSLGP